MSAPQVWLRSAIEAAAECDAYPIQAPEGVAPPYVIYERTATERPLVLNDTLNDPPPDQSASQSATITILVFVDDYVAVWNKSAAISSAIHGYSGQDELTVIESATVVDERDSEPVYMDGRDTPTYVVEMIVDVRFSAAAAS